MANNMLRATVVAAAAAAASCYGQGSENERTASLSQAVSGMGLRVEYHHGEDWSAVNNEIKPHFRIFNTSGASIPLSELTLRYYYSMEGAGPETSHCWWARSAART